MTSPVQGATRPPRQRRTSGEVRSLLLIAARDVFARKGYANAGTREIASTAGVSEGLLFTHFGSKATLFEEAVIAPLVGFLDDYVQEWENHQVGTISTYELCERFAAGFYDLLRSHRELILALLSAHRFEVDLGGTDTPATRMFTRALEKMDYLTVVEGRVRGFQFEDLPTAVRLAVGMVMSAALLDEWLFPDSTEAITRDRLVREMTMFLVHGISGPAPADAQNAELES